MPHTNHLLLIFAVLLLSSCVGPWPVIPPHTYSGTVINGATGKPLPETKIIAQRNPSTGPTSPIRMRPGPYRSTIGEAATDENGKFTLTTREGYASYITAYIGEDHYYSASYRGGAKASKKEEKNLLIELAPKIRFSYKEVDGDYAYREGLRAGEIGRMVKKIINYHDVSLNTDYLSLSEYLSRGVIDKSSYQKLIENPELFQSPGNPITIKWGTNKFVYTDINTPISFQPQ